MALYATQMTIYEEADQWFKNGDHSGDKTEILIDNEGNKFQSEGKVVRYFRHPDVDGNSVCEKCSGIMHNHGFIDSDSDSDSTIVCPGDFVVSTFFTYVPVKPEIFHEKYTLVKKVK